jgi:hypothetical protein
MPSPSRPRLQLSATQLLASALAAVTATIAGSYLGVSGTVIGAAVASVVTVTGNAVYGHSIRRTRERVRTVVPLAARWAAEHDDARPTAALPTVRSDTAPARRGRLRPWQRIGLLTVAVFVALIAAITCVELVIGRPLSDALTGHHATGTSLSQTTGSGSTPSPATRTVTQTVTPSVVTTTPTITQTAPAVTQTVAPTATPSASSSTSPATSPSSSPPASSAPPSGSPSASSTTP